ncbi:MAG TPA: hypothetical protein DCF63_16930 [Planctomycetaceae bacterium]|nr:hypothetical protein [Planctomycetaceae bacterium]
MVLALDLTLCTLMLASFGCSDPLRSTHHRQSMRLAEKVEAESSFNIDKPSLIRQSNGNLSLDAGVVFADELSYLCVPLSRIGGLATADILSMESSCDCVRPSLVRYLDSTGEEVGGLRLDFLREQGNKIISGTKPNNATILSVELKLNLRDSEERTLDVNFLQTHRADQEGIDESSR